MPGFDVINPDSEWLPPEGDIERAKEMYAEVANPHNQINLFHNDAPGHKEIAVAVQDQWAELGIETTIKAQEWAQFLEFLGPPPNDEVDVYRLGLDLRLPGRHQRARGVHLRRPAREHEQQHELV